MDLTKIEIPLRTNLYLAFSNCKKKLIKKIKNSKDYFNSTHKMYIHFVCVWWKACVGVCICSVR